MSDATPPRRQSWFIPGLLLIALLAALPFFAAPDGLERAPIAQFFGRFHPVLVHLPIGLLLLVPLLEFLGLLHIWTHLQKSAGLVLGLATIGVLGATVAGWLLAWSGGYQGETVINHLWGGIALSASCLTLVWLRPHYLAGAGRLVVRLAYMPLLLVTVGLMSWTSHQGSVITHGDDFLTKHMPAGMRSFLGIAPTRAPAIKTAAVAAAGAVPAPAPASLYVARILPVIEKNCVACHKPSKIKGGLRMDTYELLMEGGDGGPPVVAGSLEKSDLYRRITLPADDEEFMPTDGKPALTPAEIKLVGEWITAGALP